MPDATPAPRRFHWLRRHIPTRDTVHEHRMLRPFARHLTHSSLWRMTRRSVPRGVALGLFVAVIIPFMHTVIAAILAIPARANVAVAAVFTLLVKDPGGLTSTQSVTCTQSGSTWNCPQPGS